MSAEPPDRPGPGLWIGLALGVPVMAWGIRGILEESARTHPAELGRWIIGSAVVHDLVLLPLVLSIGVLARRAVPEAAWAPVRWALATTGVLLLVSWPFVRGYGRRSGNPSLLPRDYGSGLLVALAVVWLAAVLLAALRIRRGRWRASRPPA
jgi:Kef-type K+ transport system membrane component KefB